MTPNFMMYGGNSSRRRAVLEAGAISLVVLGVFAYWFGVANRHVVFLYEHRTVGIPSAQPLVHYLSATPAGYRYISAASNFFALDPALQVAMIALAAGLAASAVVFRRRVLGEQPSERYP